MSETLSERTRVSMDVPTLLKLGTGLVVAALAFFALRADNARLAEKLDEALAAQQGAQSRLAAVERSLVEIHTTLRVRGVMP